MKLKAFLCIILIITGCMDKKEQSHKIRVYNGQPNDYPSTGIATDKHATIRHVDSIILKEDNNNYIGLIWKLIQAKDFLFIPDWLSRDIKVYTMQGEMVYTIGARGEGPGEFIDVRGGITISNDTLLTDVTQNVNI